MYWQREWKKILWSLVLRNQNKKANTIDKRLRRLRLLESADAANCWNLKITQIRTQTPPSLPAPPPPRPCTLPLTYWAWTSTLGRGAWRRIGFRGCVCVWGVGCGPRRRAGRGGSGRTPPSCPRPGRRCSAGLAPRGPAAPHLREEGGGGVRRAAARKDYRN